MKPKLSKKRWRRKIKYCFHLRLKKTENDEQTPVGTSSHKVLSGITDAFLKNLDVTEMPSASRRLEKSHRGDSGSWRKSKRSAWNRNFVTFSVRKARRNDFQAARVARPRVRNACLRTQRVQIRGNATSMHARGLLRGYWRSKTASTVNRQQTKTTAV